MSLEAKETHFKRLVKDWDLATLECTRLYVLWQEARDRCERLAWEKNDAWGKLHSARLNKER